MNYPLILGIICVLVILLKMKDRDAWGAILMYWVVLCIKNLSEV